MRAKACVVFQYFDFDGKSEILKSKKPCFLLNKNTNFNKSETESKMGISWNLTHTFRETNLMLRLI